MRDPDEVRGFDYRSRPVLRQQEPVPAAAYDHRHPILPWTIKTVDVIATVVATVAIGWLGGNLLTHLQDEARDVAALMATLVFSICPKRERLLHFPQVTRFRCQVRYVGPATVLAAAVQFTTLWLLGWTPVSAFRAALVWWIGAALMLLLVRAVGVYVLTRPAVRRRLSHKVAVIGAGAHALRLAERFEQDAGDTFSMMGLFDDGPRWPGDAEVRGSISDLIGLSRERPLHSVIIALPPSADHEEQVARLTWRLRSILADVYIMPHLVHGPDMALPVESLGPVSLMVLQRRPLTEQQMVLKSALDLALGMIAFVILFPLLLAVACAIKLDSPGPVLFRQSRLGFNNCPFMVFKFRSMYTEMTDLTAIRQTARDDPRVTRVGKWLRKLSIDELPQLLNVLRGEMSLVGPRPHAPHTRAGGKLLDDALAEYVIRHQVKPGITGWAQVNGSRGELVTTDDLRKRVTLDLEYMQRWSIWFDLKIMVLTVLREVVSRHAF